MSSDHESTSFDERVADERPLLVVGLVLERDAHAFDEEPGDADQQQRAEDERVFGLGLDADAVRALHVPPADRPADADQERRCRRRRRRPSTPDTSLPCRNLKRSGIWWSISLITVAMNSKTKPK